MDAQSLAVYIATAFFVVVSAPVIYHIYFVQSQPDEPPLIKGWIPYLGVGLAFQNDPLKFLQDGVRKYGDCFSLYMAGQRFVVVTDPYSGIPSVFRNSKTLTFEPVVAHIEKNVFGRRPVEISHKEMNKDLEGLYVPYLLASNKVVDLTNSTIGNMEAVFQKGQFDGLYNPDGWHEVDLRYLCKRILFESAGKALFGDTYPGDEMDFFNDYWTWDDGFPKLAKGFPSWLMGKVYRARNNHFKRFKPALLNLTQPSEFIKKRAEVYTSYGYPLEEIVPSMFSMTFALQSNSIPASFWYIFYVLGLSKVEREQMQDLISSHVTKPTAQDLLGKSPVSPTRFVLSQLLQEPRLVAHFEETVRNQAQAFSTRQVLSDTPILINHDKTYRARKGSMIVIPSAVLHHDSEIYDSPDEFRQNRFLGSDGIESAQIKETDSDLKVATSTSKESQTWKFQKRGVPVKHFLLPFGGGNHLCPGRRFAQNEVIAFACTMLHFFEIEPVGGMEAYRSFQRKPPPDAFGMAMSFPSNPFMVKVRLRKHMTTNP